MSHLQFESLTVFSGPVIERDGTERMYVGAYIPESVTPQEKMRVQECIGFLAVPTLDPTMYPQPRDGWVARPARESEETIQSVFTEVVTNGRYEQQHVAIQKPVLEHMIGKAAITPPSQS